VTKTTESVVFHDLRFNYRGYYYRPTNKQTDAKHNFGN